jgi:hypothetical protein
MQSRLLEEFCMSGFYLIGVIALWLWLTSLLWKGLRFCVSGTDKPAGVRNGIALIVAFLWLGASFWYSGGRKFYYDWRVDQMCAVDGGVKVYETVKLPAERFDKYGNIDVPNLKYAKPTDEYYFEIDDKYFRRGDPNLIRSVTRIIRRSDGKVLGESIRYGRGGGDFPGPWHPSTFDCPSIKELRLESSIFTTGVDK